MKPDFYKIANELCNPGDMPTQKQFIEATQLALERAYIEGRESLLSRMPDDAIIAHIVCVEMDCHTNERIDGAFAAFRWLRLKLKEWGEE